MALRWSHDDRAQLLRAVGIGSRQTGLLEVLAKDPAGIGIVEGRPPGEPGEAIGGECGHRDAPAVAEPLAQHAHVAPRTLGGRAGDQRTGHLVEQVEDTTNRLRGVKEAGLADAGDRGALEERVTSRPGRRDGQQGREVHVADALERHGDALAHSPALVSGQGPQPRLDSPVTAGQQASEPDGTADGLELVWAGGVPVDPIGVGLIGHGLDELEVASRAGQPRARGEVRVPLVRGEAPQDLAMVCDPDQRRRQ